MVVQVFAIGEDLAYLQAVALMQLNFCVGFAGVLVMQTVRERLVFSNFAHAYHAAGRLARSLVEIPRRRVSLGEQTA